MMQSLPDTFPFLATWLSTATPVLPGLPLVRWAQPVLWGIVMAGLAGRLLGGRPVWVRRAAMLLAVVWVALPGAWSPAWWLGLAFQLPSLVTVLLCAGFVLAGWRFGVGQEAAPMAKPGSWRWLGAAALVLGALLLADMFVLLPFSLYRWGFSSFSFGLLLAVVLLAWVAARDEKTRHHAYLAGAALALFAVTRLPSGNVFDAVIDPWLWMVLLAGTVRHGIRQIRSRF